MVGLGDQRNDGGTRVTTNDRNELVGRVGLLDLRDEARGTDNVQGGNTEDALGVVDTLRLEDLSNNGDGGVDLFPMSESWTTSKLHKTNGGIKQISALLTGLEITRMLALGAASAQALARSRTIEALVLKRSSYLDYQRKVNPFEKHFGAYRHGSCQAYGEHRRG